MNVFRNSRTITCSIAAAAVLAAVTTIIADRTAGKKSAYEQKIDDVMDNYVEVVRRAEFSYDKKLAPGLKSCRGQRDAAVQKAGQSILAKLARAARDAKRLKLASEAALAEEKTAEFKKLIERRKTAHPVRPAAENVAAPKPEVKLIPSHVTYGRHRYLAIMGDYTLQQARRICNRLGGHLAYLDSAAEMDFLQKNLPCRHTLWVGAIDKKARGKWTWLNGKTVNARCWARGWPKPTCSRYDLHFSKVGRTNIHGALNSSGLISRAEKNICRGFICEWDR